ncbi:unnamed protein product, partial [Nesidiocoris tenuis]
EGRILNDDAALASTTEIHERATDVGRSSAETSTTGGLPKRRSLLSTNGRKSTGDVEFMPQRAATERTTELGSSTTSDVTLTGTTTVVCGTFDVKSSVGQENTRRTADKPEAGHWTHADGGDRRTNSSRRTTAAEKSTVPMTTTVSRSTLISSFVVVDARRRADVKSRDVNSGRAPRHGRNYDVMALAGSGGIGLFDSINRIRFDCPRSIPPVPDASIRLWALGSLRFGMFSTVLGSDRSSIVAG